MAGTPLWLELVPEYIDNNFEKVIAYLSAEARNKEHDSFYEETIQLLSERVFRMMDELASVPLYEYDEMSIEQRKEKLLFPIRLFSAQLLIDSLPRDFEVSIFSNLVACFALIEDSRADDLATMLAKSMGTGSIPKGWLTWEDLKADYPLSIIIHKLLDSPLPSITIDSSFELYGTIIAKDGELFIGAENSYDIDQGDHPASISILDESVNLITPKDRKLKQSNKDKIASISKFTQDFTEVQKTVKPHKKPKYAIDDDLEVEIVGVDRDGHMMVRSVNDKKELLEGIVVLEMKSLYLYWETDFTKLIPVGSVIPARYKGGNKFSIKDSFKEHIQKNVMGQKGDVIPAKLAIAGLKYSWLSEDGYLIVTGPNSLYTPGDYAIIEITSIGTGENGGAAFGVIDRSISSEDLEDQNLIETSIPFDEDDIKAYGLDGFFKAKTAKASIRKATCINTESVHGLYTTLFTCQPFCAKASGRYNLLAVCKTLAVLIGKDLDADYLSLLCDHLESIYLFANARTKDEYESVPLLNVKPEFSHLKSVENKCLVIKLLKGYGNPQSQDFISKVIDEKDDRILTHIALLVQSCGSLRGVINKSMEGVIKREILQCLTVGQDGNPNYEEEAGTNIGVEGSTIEFKTSFFEAPADAKEQNQEITIFNTICGFLNSNLGGSLYLGVNDYGYVVGLESDMEKLEYYGMKAYHGMDGYRRYIQDRAKHYFDQSIISCLTIDPAYDNQVVEIKVRPYTYDIVTVNGLPYIRVNASTQKMTEGLKSHILKERAAKKDETADKVATLMVAKKSKTYVTLCRYSSSHSGRSEDRIVEPFDFSNDMTAVWAYEPASSNAARKNKVFMLSRIGEVKPLDKKWLYESKHLKGEQDVFKMTGNTPIHIKLALKRRAYNCLIEEYPLAKEHIYEDKAAGTWILDTNLYGLEGAGRFVTGLASDIEILEGDELRKYIKDFAAKIIKEMN